MVYIAGVCDERCRYFFFQQSSHFEEILETVGSRRHDVEGIGIAGLGFYRPGNDIIVAERNCFGKDSGCLG